MMLEALQLENAKPQDLKKDDRINYNFWWDENHVTAKSSRSMH